MDLDERAERLAWHLYGEEVYTQPAWTKAIRAALAAVDEAARVEEREACAKEATHMSNTTEICLGCGYLLAGAIRSRGAK